MITVEAVRARRGEMLGTLKTIVELESPSADKAAVDRLVTRLRERIGAAGGEIEALPQNDYGDLTVARWPGNEGQKPLLVMTHIDTVWPIGTLARKPFEVDDAEARGPGIYDMKASVAMMLQALTFLRENDVSHRPITWLINTEEEVGSPVSRPVIEKLASESEYVLVLEPPDVRRRADKQSAVRPD